MSARIARWGIALPDLVVAAAVLAFLVVKYRLIPSLNVHWDEFQFLSRIHEFQRGDLNTAFQTFHVHLFGWLATVRDTEVDQVVAGRYVMYALRVASVILVFLLAARLASRSAALVAVLGMLTFSFLLRHGESFRADPLIVFLFLLAATLLVWRIESAAAVVIAGMAVALAFSISVKAAIFAPTLVCLLALMWWSGDPGARHRRLRGVVLFATTAVTAYAICYLAHAAATSSSPAEVVQRAAASGGGMFGNAQTHVFTRTVRWDWPFWLLCAVGGAIAAVDAVRSRHDPPRRFRALLVMSLLLPLISLDVYRNTYPYFYATLVPLAALAGAYAVARVKDVTGPRWHALVVLSPAVALSMRGAQFVGAIGPDETRGQRAVLTAVHAMFPEPVPYLDRCGMVSSFPGANMFMSTYVTAAYRRGGKALMPRIVATRQPRFLVANVMALELDKPWTTVSASGHRLLQEDFEFLQSNFVHHWGPIWVPGKRLSLREGTDVQVTIVIAGAYTVESGAPVRIDGTSVAPNQVVELAAGTHRIAGTGAVTLRSGARLPYPSTPLPAQGLFLPL
jgi:hypothetical protein